MVLLSIAGCHSGDQRKPLLIIMAGQSNMVGHIVPDELPRVLLTFPDNTVAIVNGIEFETVHELNASQKFLRWIQTIPILARTVNLTDLRHYVRENRFGPEVAVAHELSKSYPERDIVILKYAVGGSSLADWAPHWDSEYAAISQKNHLGSLFAELSTQIGELKEEYPDISPAAVFWMQGERDSRFAPLAKDYKANLSSFIIELRRELSAPSIPFIMGRVNPPRSSYPFVERVRAAQEAVANEISHVYVINTDDLSHSDTVHHDTLGDMELGRRFVDTFQKIRADLSS